MAQRGADRVEELDDEFLRQIARAANTLPRERLLAAIDGEEPAGRVIEVDSGGGPDH